MSKTLQRALDAVGNSDTISLPGITFTVYRSHDPAACKDRICCVLNQRDYFTLEVEAQQRGKSVHDHLYAEMRENLKASGFNTPSDAFFVTTSPPDDLDTGMPPADHVTLQ